MLTVFSGVGVIGNAIVFYIFCGRRSTSTSVVFILALAGVDFFACLVAIPYTIVFEHVRYNLVYDGACKLYMFLITSIQPFSAYIMMGIALDRYFCICHPFLYVFTVPRAKAVVLCMAIPALIFGVITALSHGMYIYEVSILNENNTRIVLNQFIDKEEAEAFVALRNISSEHPLIRFIHYHQCVNNTYIFSREFLNIYKKFHAMNFVLAYIVSIFTRRVKKAKRKKSNLYPTSSNKTRDNTAEETQMTAINGCSSSNTKSLNNQTRKDAKYARKITLTARNDPSTTITDTQTGSLKRKRPGTFKDRNLMANIKTAFMLFIVTLVFIIAYLPLIGFYVYFVYNVANPFIYAFMNQTFREDLKKMMKVCKR
ncbi:unnamed protein product [Candidula unifasciata]|uniref:G-protein coupled receptors family 1 profile domain-containing protein n=1 Tax=Candidula unifasciata TaxID=100452 RepID=A0A8S3Z186_9EUPU|nr:unnamed protein product [Candidula unifasciata]